jgi:predicted enzyme related to lactoylglutathione lyase
MHYESHTPGSFCTSVLRTRDLQRAAAFYNALGGWTVEPVAGTRQHVLMLFDGKAVASLQDVFEGQDEWVPHVSVTDIERLVADAIALGGTLVDTADANGFARLATLRDPEGALFGLWQPAPHQGAELMEDIGSLWWPEVLSRDVETARLLRAAIRLAVSRHRVSALPFVHRVQTGRRAGGRHPETRSRMEHGSAVEFDFRCRRLRRHVGEG